MIPVLTAFLSDQRTLALLLLIVVDLVVGIIAALRAGVFAWRRVGDFYAHNVIPFLLGYGLIYAIGALGVGALLGPIWQEVAQTVGAGPAVISLVASIGANLLTIRTPPTHPTP